MGQVHFWKNEDIKFYIYLSLSSFFQKWPFKINGSIVTSRKQKVSLAFDKFCTTLTHKYNTWNLKYIFRKYLKYIIKKKKYKIWDRNEKEKGKVLVKRKNLNRRPRGVLNAAHVLHTKRCVCRLDHLLNFVCKTKFNYHA